MTAFATPTTRAVGSSPFSMTWTGGKRISGMTFRTTGMHNIGAFVLNGRGWRDVYPTGVAGVATQCNLLQFPSTPSPAKTTTAAGRDVCALFATHEHGSKRMSPSTLSVDLSYAFGTLFSVHTLSPSTSTHTILYAL